jgi:hypothetical protein
MVKGLGVCCRARRILAAAAGSGWALLGVFWLLRGMPGASPTTATAALQFVLIDGLGGTTSGIGSLVVICM